MPNPEFFRKKGPFTLIEIANLIDAEIIGDKNFLIHDIAPLHSANYDNISFLNNTKYIKDFKQTKAGSCIIKKAHIQSAPENINLLICEDPYLAYAKTAYKFYPKNNSKTYISDKSTIHSSAKIGKNCYIATGAFIDEDAIIGDNCKIGVNSYIGCNVKLGNTTTVNENVTLKYCMVGDNCIVHPGVRIGQDGFGFAASKTGIEKVPQLGLVIIGNNVEIGANSCIDRGAIANTTIGNNCKIDNLVQIGHNVEIGDNTFIVSQTGIAGSTKIGNNVMLGGQVGIAGHLNIGDNVMIAAQGGVMQDIPDNAVVGGSPTIPIKDWHRQSVILKKMIKKSKENNG